MKLLRNKIFLLVVVSVLLVALVCLAVYLKSVFDYQQAVGKITFESIDISGVADGDYIGECDVGFIYAKVKATVQESEIAEIQILEHKNERGQAAETVLDRIVEEQKIDVDAITGATNSSVVLKKAVANALTQ